MTPKLRFPEFTNKWTKVKLDDIFSYEQPTKYLVESTNYNNSYKTPVLTAGKTFILGYTNETRGIFSNGLPVTIFDDFTTTSKFVDFPFKLKSSAAKILHTKEGFNLKIANTALSRINYEVKDHQRHWISIFSNLEVALPDTEEQEKIAEFLAAVDERIELANRKVEKLETYKRGLTQKIFTRTLCFKRDDGSDFPEWEEKKIFDIALIKKGVQLNKDSMISEGFPVINGGVEPSGYTDSFNTEEGSITISEGGNSCGFVNYINEKFWSGGHCYVIVGKGDVEKIFLLQMLKFRQADIMKLRVGSGLPNIQKKDLESMIVSVPVSVIEQQKIAAFLSQIDEKITLETEKLEELKKFKKALLQRMFV